MYTKTVATNAWSVLGAAAVACALFAGSAAADDHEFTVAIHVSTRGLDLSQPPGAQRFYMRLQNAADDACGDQLGLAPVTNPKTCYEKALADAIRSANVPLVTQIYFATHTLREAAAHGIGVPAEIAAK